MSKQSHIDYTRLTDAGYKDLLRELDRARSGSDRPSEAKDRRRHERFPCHIRNVPLTIVYEAGGEARFLVHARNISCGGMAFFHGGYIHTGSTCWVLLPLTSGGSKAVPGQIVGCRHVMRHIHEVSVKFHEDIDVTLFQETGDETDGSAQCSVAIPELSGVALCASPDLSLRASLCEWLRQTGLDVIETQAIQETLDKLKSLSCVLCLVDEALCEGDAARLAGAVRGTGFAKPLILIVKSAGEVRGADAVLCQPVAEAQFFGVIGRTGRMDSLSDTSPIYSTLPRDPGATALIEQYITQAQAAADQLQRALETDDLRIAETTCTSLISTAGTYGFAELGRIAAQASAVLNSTRSLKRAEQQVVMLISICRRMTAESPPRPATAAAAT